MNWLRRRVTLEEEGLANSLLNSSFLRRRTSRDSLNSVEDSDEPHHGERHFLPILPQALRRKSKVIRKGDSTATLVQDTPKTVKEAEVSRSKSTSSKANCARSHEARKSDESVVSVEETKEKYERRLETLQKQLDDMRACHLREVCRLKQENRLKEIEPDRELDSVDLFSTNAVRPPTGTGTSGRQEKDPKKLHKMLDDKREEVDKLNDQCEKQRERLLAYKALAAQRTMLFERSMELVLEVLRRQGYNSIASYLAAVPNEQREQKSIGDVVIAVEQEVDTSIKKAKAMEIAQKEAEKDRSRFWSVESEEEAEAIAAEDEAARSANRRMSQFAIDLSMPTVPELEAAISKVHQSRDFIAEGSSRKARQSQEKIKAATAPGEASEIAQVEEIKKHPFLDVSALLSDVSKQTTGTQTEEETVESVVAETRKRKAGRSNTIDKALGVVAAGNLHDSVVNLSRLCRGRKIKHHRQGIRRINRRHTDRCYSSPPSHLFCRAGGSLAECSPLHDSSDILKRKIKFSSKTSASSAQSHTGRTVEILKVLCQLKPPPQTSRGRNSMRRWRRASTIVPAPSWKDEAKNGEPSHEISLTRRKSESIAFTGFISALENDDSPLPNVCSKCSNAASSFSQAPFQDSRRPMLIDAAINASVGASFMVDRGNSPVGEIAFSSVYSEVNIAKTAVEAIETHEDEEIPELLPSGEIQEAENNTLAVDPLAPRGEFREEVASPRSATRKLTFRKAATEPKRSAGGEQHRIPADRFSIPSDSFAMAPPPASKRRPEVLGTPNVSSSECTLPEINDTKKLIYVRDEPAFQRTKAKKRTAIF